MAELIYNDGTLKLVGEGHVRIAPTLLTAPFLEVLIEASPESDFYLPDLFDILADDTVVDLRRAFQTVATTSVLERFKQHTQRFASMQPKRAWVIQDLVPVWRTRLGLSLIDEIIRVRDGSAYVVLAGSGDILSEHDLYRRTLKTIAEHLDSYALDAVTIAKYTKLTLLAPIAERTICVSGEHGIATVKAWGPANLDCSQWELPAGLTFISLES